MQLSPVFGGGGIEVLEAGSFDLHCFQTLTGTLLRTEFGYISLYPSSLDEGNSHNNDVIEFL